jgi:glycosidase
VVIGLLFLICFSSMAQKSTNDKLIIYQIFTRLFGNENTTNKFYGNIEDNGVGKFNDINEKALKSIKNLGVSHVWFTGVIEHATMTDYSAFGIKKDNPQVVKGKAGSPYAIKDYYDVDPDLAVNVDKRMEEYENLVKRSHAEGLKVIIDFVPNHLAREYNSDAKPKGTVDFGEDDDNTKAFDSSNNFYYLPKSKFKVPENWVSPVQADADYEELPAKVTGNDVFSASPSINDWFETIKLNYGVDYQKKRVSQFDPVPDTWLKMRELLLFWSAKGIDAFRCDMAQMVPVEFWEWVIKEVKIKYPEQIFIAEIYETDKYEDYIFRGGFDYLYDKVGLYDALRKLMEGGGNANDITAVWQKESGEYAQHMLRFLENHDEQRITSKEFAGDAKIGIPAMALSAFLHDGPLMLYYGQEIGLKPNGAEGFQSDDGRTSIFDYWGLEEMSAWSNGGKWNTNKLTEDQKSLRKQYQEINEFATENEAITEGKFFDLQYVNMTNKAYNDTKTYSFLRYTDNQKMLFIFNFDLEKQSKFNLVIPDLAYSMMGIDNQKMKLKALNSKHKTGLKNIILKPNSYLTFELK